MTRQRTMPRVGRTLAQCPDQGPTQAPQAHRRHRPPLARPQAPGLTPRAIVEKFATIQMVDLHVPTADGRHLVLARHTQPSNDHELLLRQLDLALPKQSAPKLLS